MTGPMRDWGLSGKTRLVPAHIKERIYRQAHNMRYCVQRHTAQKEAELLCESEEGSRRTRCFLRNKQNFALPNKVEWVVERRVHSRQRERSKFWDHEKNTKG